MVHMVHTNGHLSKEHGQIDIRVSQERLLTVRRCNTSCINNSKNNSHFTYKSHTFEIARMVFTMPNGRGRRVLRGCPGVPESFRPSV